MKARTSFGSFTKVSMQRAARPSWCVLLALMALGATLVACGGSDGPAPHRVVILGFDGMDYGVTTELMAEGRMPNFARLAAAGSFGPLATAVPPQSPVAWSDFITGMDSGGHGIFDFVHRNPDTILPYLSTSETVGSERNVRIGKYKFPLAGGEVVLLRHGKAFWETLEENGVESHIYRMPANFPPSGRATRELSGMGTPDVLGTPGTFSFYTSDLFVNEREVSGGAIFALDYWDYHAEGTLVGPDNPFLVERRRLTRDFDVYVDPDLPVVKLVVGKEERILQLGEWSDWVTVEFEMIPTQTLSATARFFLRSIEPELEIYVSPLQIDPTAPAMPISTPESYAAELAEATGRFYTQGMPEDTKSLSEGVFTVEEFLAQARIAGDEIFEQFKHVLDRFEGQLLFYYFGNLDQISHMLFRAMDPGHPGYDPENDPAYRDEIVRIYETFDRIAGYAAAHVGEDTRLVIMSDHGFASWRRAFHLNTWLIENGYMVLRKSGPAKGTTIYDNVDWSRTRAYGLGLNGLYINLRGREASGIVPPEQREALMTEISEKLLATIDPATGKPAVTRMYPREQTYMDAGYLELGPDLQVGYAKGTRCSFESAIGDLTDEVFTDNLDLWSGDHCMDHTTVPGILLTNGPLARPARSLKELNYSILAEFGLVNEAVEAMDGGTAIGG
jgi:predicted AlkP superfamily phosphohydrolase/phosphomutase